MKKHTLIIAEAGVNHNGDVSLAKKLIDVAADAGADYVKFQTFKAEKLVSDTAPKADYQRNNMQDDVNDGQLEMLKKLELSQSDHYELIEYCKQKNVKFLSTAFDMDSLNFLHQLGIEIYKVPSGEITNLPYLAKVGSFKKPVILSTGMCVMEEITAAIAVLKDAGASHEDITVLHCTTDYPTAMTDVNLNAMLAIKKKLAVTVGYSDHTLGIEVPIAAVALGATVIEKHFTLDKNLPGPDHIASLEPTELKAMITAIRNIESALGNNIKSPSQTELKNRLVARKSIHLVRNIAKGEKITLSDLIMKRPGTGISPMELNSILNLTANKDLYEGNLLTKEDLL